MSLICPSENESENTSELYGDGQVRKVLNVPVTYRRKSREPRLEHHYYSIGLGVSQHVQKHLRDRSPPWSNAHPRLLQAFM